MLDQPASEAVAQTCDTVRAAHCSTDLPQATYVNHIPDLMTWEDYEVSHERKLVRFRLTVTDQGLEIVGDSPYPHLLEQLLAKLGPEVIEMMLCG